MNIYENRIWDENEDEDVKDLDKETSDHTRGGLFASGKHRPPQTPHARYHMR